MFFKTAAAFCIALVASGYLRATLVAQPVDMLFRHWSTRDGLPNNRVRDVILTRDGFIWLATDSGAVRFDGMNFSVFGLREGLPAPIVLSMRQAVDGTLWFGTLGGGLSVFRNGAIEKTYTTADGLPSNWVMDLQEDEFGRLVALTRSGSVRFQENRFVPLPKEADPPLPMREVKRDGDGILWGISGAGTLCAIRNGSWWKEESGVSSQVDVIAVDPKGRLWVAGGGSLWLRENGTWHENPLPEAFRRYVSGLASASDGTLWLAFHRFGLCGFKEGVFITPKPTARFTQDQVETVYSTADGQLWVTSANGLYRMSHTRIETYLLDDHESPSAANILGGMVEVADGEYIIATQGSGFYRWAEGRSTRLSDEAGLGAGGYGNAVMRSANGTVWLGAKSGLYRMGGDSSIRRQPLPGYPGDEIWSITENAEGIWVGTGAGKLHLLRGGEAETVDFGGGTAPVKSFASQPDGTFWVGTRGDGLFRRGKDGWKRFDRNTGLLSDIIRVLYLDAEGRLWIGSDGGGLSLWRGDEGFVSITSTEGLPSNTVSQIVHDKLGRLWVGTHRGFAVFGKESLSEIAAGRVRNLQPMLVNEADGMPADELTIVPPLLASDGTALFATVRGFCRLRMEDFQPKPTRPRVLMEGIRANGKEVRFSTRPVELPPGSSRLEFTFTGLDFHDPVRLKFRRRMIGFEDDWVNIGSRRISEFSNMPPGRYRFQVEASSGSGLWSAEPAVVDVLIAPHFWQTRWFRAGGVLAALALVAAPVWIFERTRARREIEAMKRRQAVDAERARIARDLHDDIGSSLTQIALQSQLAERNVTRDPERAGGHLKEVFNTASRITRTLDEIIWAVNPVHDTLENFILFLGSHTQDIAESAGLRCRFDLPEAIPSGIMPSDVRHDLYLAAKEVLHNIVKHADASEVFLRIHADGRDLVIAIGDDGKGMGEAEAGIGADGLGNMRTRLARSRGTCVCHSEPGKGTVVEMRVPMGRVAKTMPCPPRKSDQTPSSHE